MKKAVFIASFLTLCVQPAFADSDNSQEEKLLELIEKGKQKAAEQVSASSPKSPDQPKSPSASSTPPQPILPGDEDLITKLSRQVNSLKQKDAISKVQFVSTQRPRDLKRVGTNTVYDYKEGAVYEIHAGVDRITDIQLQEGEELSGPPVSGDTVRWKISVIQSGKKSKQTTHIILKPLEPDIETNLILTTDKHTYHLKCVSSDWYMPSVSWNYPQEESAEYQEMFRKEQTEEPLVVTPDKLDFNYEIDGDSYSWKPLRVFDDGQKTFIQMPHDYRVSEAPVLFVIDEDEADPILVNYRVKGDYYVVDRLFDNAELRVGTRKTVEIEKKVRRSLFDRLF